MLFIKSSLNYFNTLNKLNFYHSNQKLEMFPSYFKMCFLVFILRFVFKMFRQTLTILQNFIPGQLSITKLTLIAVKLTKLDTVIEHYRAWTRKSRIINN